MKTALTVDQIHALVRQQFPQLERVQNTQSTSYFLGKKSVSNRVFRLKPASQGLLDLKLAQSHASERERSRERVDSLHALATWIEHEIALLREQSRISAQPASRNPADAIVTLPGYTGAPPTEFAMGIIRSLRKEGFSVTATTQGPVAAQRRTLRITWQGIFIGAMSEQLWLHTPSYACLYRFPKDDALASVAKAPPHFDRQTFAREHRCDPDRLHVYTDYSGSYLHVEDETTTLLLMQDWARSIDTTIHSPAADRDAQSLEVDLEAILADHSKSETERLAAVAVRLGQGQFRADLEREFEGACAVTGLTILSALRASHIVPWRHSTDEERLDPKNGLLLSANLDALFDRFMITFRPDGKLRVSQSIGPDDLEMLGPLQDLQCTPCQRRAAFLRVHNAEFDRRETRRAVWLKTPARLPVTATPD